MPPRCSADKAGVASGPSLTMEFRILGPLEAVAEGRVVPLNAAKPRALLAILLLHANELVSSDRLIEDLWGGRPPATAAKILQKYVSQLRRALGRVVIRTASSAYELAADAGSFDLLRFEQLVGNARAAAPADANAMLREALSLWRGPASGRVRLRALGAVRDRKARGASARSPAAADRDGSRAWRGCRARPRARAVGRPAPAPGAPPRPADARPLPLGTGRRTPLRRIAMRGARSSRRSASSRRSRSGSSNARSSTRIRRSITSPPSLRPTAQRRRSRAWRVARRPSWGGRVSCGRSGRF